MLLYISLLLIVFSLILIFHNWNINKNSIFLAVFLMLMATYGLTHYFSIYGKSVFWMAILYNNISPFMLLPGPFLYFYIRGTLKDKQGLKWKDGFHFIPAIIHFIGVIPYYLSSFSYKKSVCYHIIMDMNNIKNYKLNLFFDTEFNFLFRIVHLSIYVLYCIFLLWKFSKKRKKFDNIPNKQYLITYRWLKILLFLLLFLIINYFLILCAFFYLNTNEFKKSEVYINITTLLSFGFFVISLLFYPEILYGMPRVKKEKKKQIKRISTSSKSKQIIEKEVSDSNVPDPFLELSQNMQSYFDTEKPYLNQDFSIAQISIAMGVPQNHVSYCINSIFKTKFTKLKTQLRVEHTKILLKESLHNNITIDGISQLSGFSSRSNFYSAFKEITGITPSDYLKAMELEEE